MRGVELGVYTDAVVPVSSNSLVLVDVVGENNSTNALRLFSGLGGILLLFKYATKNIFVNKLTAFG